MRRLIVLRLVLLLPSVSLLAQAQTLRDLAVPAREDPSSRRPDPEIWQRLVGQPRSGEAIIGLKSADAPRGMWRDVQLASRDDISLARITVAAIPGVEILHVEDTSPFLIARLKSEAALAAVRALAVVDYVHPRYFRPQLSSTSGCDKNSYEETDFPGPPKETFRVQTVTNGNPQYAPFGDFVPWSFLDLASPGGNLGFSARVRGHRIPQAWRRTGGGAGVTVGVLDTGASLHQLEIAPTSRLSYFDDGNSSGRTMQWYEQSGDDQCGHGTRVATMAVGAMNGSGVVGAAWKANAVVVQTGPDVFMSGWDDYLAVIEGIRYIACGSSSCDAPTPTRRIVVMAFGDDNVDSSALTDEIVKWYNRGVLFLAASGTNACYGWGGDDAPLYPANLPEVIDVGCVDPRNGLRTRIEVNPFYTAKACRSTDLVGIWGPDVPTGGMNSDNDEVMGFGGTSGCVATVAGIAALTWGAHPYWSREQVTTRLRQSGHNSSSPDDQIGYGVVDAFKAVGGIHGVSIKAPPMAARGLPFRMTQDVSALVDAVVGGNVRYERTDGYCNGLCRYNGTSCTGTCPLVATCPPGEANTYCLFGMRNAATTAGQALRTKLTAFDMLSLDQADDVAMASGSIADTCATDRHWSMRGPGIGHVIGALGTDGTWSSGSEGYMQYGPYTRDVPAGNNVATWSLALGLSNSPVPDGVPLVRIEVFDSDAQVGLGFRDLTKADLFYILKCFSVPFYSIAGHALEFRVYSYGRALITEAAVGHSSSAAPLAMHWSMDQVGHIVGGVSTPGAWTVWQGAPAGFMQYGPYTRAISAGPHMAVWELAVENNQTTAPMVQLEVVDADDGLRQLASRILTGQEWMKPNMPQYFGLPFVLSPDRVGHRIELRVYWFGNGTVTETRVGVN